MNAFQFQTVPTIISEFGAARQLGALLRKQYPAQVRLCVVTDGFLHKSGLLAPALADLARHGWQVTVIDDVVADPPESVVLDAAERARQADAEVVLGLGGGSSMDVAKLLAVLLAGQQPLADMYGVGKVSGQRLPLVQMPTTAGTGSEVTAVSIVTTGETTKMGVVAPQLYADLAILDAELTLGLPGAATAYTGIDAMVHAIEAYTSAHLKNPVSDMLAIKALELLSRHILTACRDGGNKSAQRHAAGRHVRRPGLRQFAGRGRACAGISHRRHFPCSAWVVERAGAGARAEIQRAGRQRALCRNRRGGGSGRDGQRRGQDGCLGRLF